MQRLLITGSSGYLGSALVQHFRDRGVVVMGIDLKDPAAAEPDQFQSGDICDPDLPEWFRKFAPDSVIHAAFLLDPTANQETAHRVNVRGSENVLRAVVESQPGRFMVVSSATAYGAWPDNPVPILEDWPLRAREGFRYAADKVTVEKMISEFAVKHPDMAVSVVRPTVIGGPLMDNYLRKIFFEMLFLIRLDGHDQSVQLVHEEDVVGAIDAILACEGRGAFNIAPDDAILLSEIGQATGHWVIPLPFWLARICHPFTGLFRLPIGQTHQDFLYFGRYPWVVSADRLRRETGYEFRHTGHDTMRAILGHDAAAERQ